MRTLTAVNLLVGLGVLAAGARGIGARGVMAPVVVTSGVAAAAGAGGVSRP